MYADFKLIFKKAMIYDEFKKDTSITINNMPERNV